MQGCGDAKIEAADIDGRRIRVVARRRFPGARPIPTTRDTNA